MTVFCLLSSVHSVLRKSKSMNIKRIQLDHYRIPLPAVLSDSTHGHISHFGLITARIRTASDLEGTGYSYVVGDIGGKALHTMLGQDLAPLLLGQDAHNREGLWEHMWWHMHFVGRGGLASFALATLDIALWDLAGKAQDLPWYRLLGGTRQPVKAYAGGIDLQFSLDALLQQADGFLAQGFRAIKMKVGRAALAEDVARVRAMRQHLGDGFPLMADANMRWSAAHAIQAARALAAWDVFWLEEPVIPDDFAAHARIAREGGLPIATGENLHSVYEFQTMLDLGQVAYPEPDLVTLGGVTPWLRVAHLCAARNLPVTTHGVHDLHVHLLAAIPNASYLEVHGFGLEHFMQEPLALAGGAMLPPARPGHGVELDWARLEAHRASAAVLLTEERA